MEDKKERLRNFINNLSKEDFIKLVKNYNKEYYKTDDVRITDGPYDGGNDLEIYLKEKYIKKNIQITVQKTFEKKIYEDIKKAKKNVDKFDYQRDLIFYTSQNISKSSKDKYIIDAEVNYEINLKIIDANYFIELSDNYQSIIDTIFDIYGLIVEEYNIDNKKKILYDLLSEGKDTIDIKDNFIFSYILTYLYDNPKSSINDIYNNLKDVFLDKYSKDFFRGKLNKLEQLGNVDYDRSLKKYILTELSKNKIDEINKNSSLYELELKTQINDFLKKNKIQATSNELLNILIEIYQKNYEIDIDQLSSKVSSFSNSIKKVYNEIIKFFEKTGFSPNDSKKLTDELLSICSDSYYLNKIGLSIL